MKVHSHSHRRSAFTVAELIVAVGIFAVMTGVLYKFFQHYSRLYMKVDDKVESVAEAWQLSRILIEDLQCVDFPDGDPSKWKEILTISADGAFNFFRRKSEKIEKVVIVYDEKKGLISRESGSKFLNLMKNRCRKFELKVVSEPENATAPTSIHFDLNFELENRVKQLDQATPVILNRKIFPVFLNLKLKGEFVQKGIP
ncbi:MAG: hypothetical protein HQM10_20990 [Candidatus Riflebacteria bacterium]|nr:hypothetical protein [Candidatus Riflebacteria bacterium]